MTETMQNTSQAALKFFWRIGDSRQVARVAAAGLNKKVRAGSVALSSYSCISARSPWASYLSLQVLQARGRWAEERTAQLPHHRAPEPPPAAEGQTPVTSPVLRPTSGSWDKTQNRRGLPGVPRLATFTHPGKGFEEGHGSGELPPAAARAWGWLLRQADVTKCKH